MLRRSWISQAISYNRRSSHDWDQISDGQTTTRFTTLKLDPDPFMEALNGMACPGCVRKSANGGLMKLN